jgi:hemerythrin-like domain-containing protein
MANPEIFDRLKQDHGQHRLLLDKLEDSKGVADRREELFARFKVEVTAHAAAEEESLYATMLAMPDLREDAQHSVSEHKEIEDFLAELEGMEVGSEVWESTFKHMKERYLHHINEEETEMFPDAARRLSDAQEAKLADTFKKRKPAELERAQAE